MIPGFGGFSSHARTTRSRPTRPIYLKRTRPTTTSTTIITITNGKPATHVRESTRTYRDGREQVLPRVVGRVVVQLHVELVGVSHGELQLDGIHRGVAVELVREHPAGRFGRVRPPHEGVELPPRPPRINLRKRKKQQKAFGLNTRTRTTPASRWFLSGPAFGASAATSELFSRTSVEGSVRQAIVMTNSRYVTGDSESIAASAKRREA